MSLRVGLRAAGAVVGVAALALLAGRARTADKTANPATKGRTVSGKPSDEELKKRLTPLQYEVTQHEGTEPPFRNEYWNNHEDGIYRCAGCGAELFGSDTKFESGSGWPSFTEPKVAEAVTIKRDISHGMIRTEVVCKRCGGHLGHVFEDGPRDRGGLRYCMNSCAMEFDPAAK